MRDNCQKDMPVGLSSRYRAGERAGQQPSRSALAPGTPAFLRCLTGPVGIGTRVNAYGPSCQHALRLGRRRAWESTGVPLLTELLADLFGPMRQLPVRPDEVAGVAVRVLQQIVLVLGLGLPERTCGGHLRDDLARPQAGGVDIGYGVQRGLPLLVIGVVDGGAVARPYIVALTVPGGRVVDLEEELEQVPVGGLLRIEGDFDGLGMVSVVPVCGFGTSPPV